MNFERVKAFVRAVAKLQSVPHSAGYVIVDDRVLRALIAEAKVILEKFDTGGA